MVYKLAIGLGIFVAGAGTGSHAQSNQAALDSHPNIAKATWETYKDMYPTSALCSAHEITLWTCDGEKKTYSLCSSRKVTEDSGYIQYRVGNGHHVTLEFPSHKRAPKGLFTYAMAVTGDAWVTFRDAGHSYQLIDPLRHASAIHVSDSSDGHDMADVDCHNGNQSLQLNYTIKLMTLSGLFKL